MSRKTPFVSIRDEKPVNQLIVNYPQLDGINHMTNTWSQYQNIHETTLLNNLNILDPDLEEAVAEQSISYLDDVIERQKKQLQGRVDWLKSVRKLDLNNLNKLPEDILKLIQSFIPEEIEYARVFGVVVKWYEPVKWSWHNLNSLWWVVPKEIIVAIFKKKQLYVCKQTAPGLGSYLLCKDKKYEWIEHFWREIEKEFGDEKNKRTPIYKLMMRDRRYTNVNEPYRITRYYKALLMICVFKKYKLELQSQIQNKKEKLDKLNKSAKKIKNTITTEP